MGKRDASPFLRWVKWIDVALLNGCDHNSFQRGIIFRPVKELVSSVSAIEGLVNYFTEGDACSSR